MKSIFAALAALNFLRTLATPRQYDLSKTEQRLALRSHILYERGKSHRAVE